MENSLIDYWSYSSMTALLRNPLAFKKKYILKIYDDISSPSAVVGSACHKALESYYNGKDTHEAIGVGLDYINNLSDTGINYGKTGSREKIISTFNQAINFYFEEMQAPYEILGVELGITAEIETVDGQKFGLPAKSFSDLVTRNKLGELEVIDHKFVTSYSDGDVDNFSHFIQAMFNYHTIKSKFGEAPARIIFNECKVSRNKDNTPQIQPYTYEFGSTADFATFYKLYDSCTRLINLDGMIFLPNPNDIFDGQITFEVFRSGVIGVDRPASVKHKTEQRQFVEKNYVASAFDSVENQDLTPEERIRLKLQEFGIPVEMKETHVGPSVTQYTLKPSKGISMAKIASTHRDLAIALEARSLRVAAPIPGTSLVGVEVPSSVRKTIELAKSHFIPNTLSVPVGVDVHGTVIHKDLADMPHLLIAGATGSGKSVMLNVLIDSLTNQMGPERLKMVLIDPKQVELAGFEGLAHLLMPVVHNNIAAAQTLDKMVKEMEARYKQLRAKRVRTIEEYNAKGGAMPKIVIVVDEFADLMMMSDGSKSEALAINIKEFTGEVNDLAAWKLFEGKKITQKDMKAAIQSAITNAIPDVEHSIIRIAQKARAVGIHLVLATQRPSADVVTGLIKANIPTKIAFMTTSKVNSQIVLDQTGAEELTGKGDMLFLDPTKSGLQRLQGLYA